MRKQLLACAVASGLLAVYSCNKSEVKSGGATSITPIKQVNAVGPPSAYGTFLITNVASSKVLECKGDANLMFAQTKNVEQYTSLNSGTGTAQNQKWYLIQQGTGTITSSTTFKIMNVANGMYLEAPDGNNGTQLFVDHSNGFPSQAWTLHQVGTSTSYYIQNANGLVLTNYGGSTTDGQAIIQSNLANNTTQYWTLNNITAEAYRDDAVVQFFHRHSGSISFDQGSSIPLTNGSNNGKVIWVGEDTYSDNNGGWDASTGTYPCGQYFDVHNSMLLQPASHSWDNTQTPNLVLHNSTNKYECYGNPTGSGSYTWPGVGIEIGSHVYQYAYEGGTGSNTTVLYDITENTSGLDWGTAVRHTIPNVSSQTTCTYPTGMVNPGGGYVYAYGGFSDAFGGSYMLVARFATGSPFSWTFWDGSTWAAAPSTASAAQLNLNGGSTKGALTNRSVSYVNGKYVLVEADFGYSCPDPSQPHNIYISTSTSPTGPFTARKTVYAIVDKINGYASNYYVTNIHPQFNNAHNELLVTYCLNYTGCSGASTCTNNRLDPFYYQVKAVRIPYSAAGL